MADKVEITITNRHRYAVHSLGKLFRPDKPRTILLTERQLKVVRGNPWLWIHGEDWESPDVDLDSLNVSELRDRLRAMDLPVSGRKSELIERILEYEEGLDPAEESESSEEDENDSPEDTEGEEE